MMMKDKNTQKIEAKVLFLFLVFGLFGSIKAQTSVCKHLIGGSLVELHRHETNKAKGLIFIALHDNENTCVEVMLPLLKQRQKGIFVELRAQGNRLIDFNYQKKRYAADPNRIFGPDSLAIIRHAFYLSPALVKARQTELLNVWKYELKALAQQLVQSIEGAKIIVSLHNNFHYSDEGSYNLTWYLNGGKEAHQARAIYINPRQANSDFFLVTDPFFFAALQERGFNVVLQVVNPSDDGSLSVYCAKRGLTYINIEARHGHHNQQKAMIEAVYEIIQHYNYRVD